MIARTKTVGFILLGITGVLWTALAFVTIDANAILGRTKPQTAHEAVAAVASEQQTAV